MSTKELCTVPMDHVDEEVFGLVKAFNADAARGVDDEDKIYVLPHTN